MRAHARKHEAVLRRAQLGSHSASRHNEAYVWWLYVQILQQRNIKAAENYPRQRLAAELSKTRRICSLKDLKAEQSSQALRSPWNAHEDSV